MGDAEIHDYQQSLVLDEELVCSKCSIVIVKGDPLEWLCGNDDPITKVWEDDNCGTGGVL